MNEKLEKWKEKYFNEKLVDVKKEFTQEERDTLKKLGVELKDKIYTEYEFEVLDGDVILYYYDDEMTDEEKAETQPLPENVTREEYNKLLKKIDKINDKYKF